MALLHLVLGLLLAGCAGPERPTGRTYTVISRMGLAYGPLPVERGDLYLPQGTATRPPIVLVIHGGGWVAGDRNAAGAYARLLATNGIAAFNIDYRLADTAKPDTRWPAQLVDAQLAVRWLRVHSRDYGFDESRMGAVGDSAGGQLAEMLGVTKQIVAGDQSGQWPDRSAAVDAVVDQFGPVDLTTMPQWVSGSYVPLFGTQTPTPDMLASMSPLPGVTSHSAPTLIIQGNADVIVPPAQSQQLQNTLRLAGVPVELVHYNGGHGYEATPGDVILSLQKRGVNWMAAELRR